MKIIVIVIKKSLGLFFRVLITWLVIDFFFGNLIIKWMSIDSIEHRYRIKSDIYHHDLKKNYKGIGIWGDDIYDFCTDDNAFRISCNTTLANEKQFDVAFIGDSFTEGSGVLYEKSFVGIFAKSYPNLKVANLAVQSYSPSIYFSKVKHLLESGYKFKNLFVFIDISDVQDEALAYALTEDGRVIDKVSSGVVQTPLKRKIANQIKRVNKWLFPLTYRLNRIRKDYFKWKSVKGMSVFKHDRSMNRSSWTYIEDADGYGDLGVSGAVEKSIDAMHKLSELASKYQVKLSVGVYPWPAQILFDNVDSKQVSIWRNFCDKNCYHFFNLFDFFHAKKNQLGADELIKQAYFFADVHFNEEGNRLFGNEIVLQWDERVLKD